MFNIRHVVFDRREGLRCFFVDTETKREYFLSLNPKDIKYLKYGGINFLLPPLNKKHIKGTW
jgi:hypothetical protein